MKLAIPFICMAFILASLCAGMLVVTFDEGNYASNLEKNAIGEKLPDAGKRTENVLDYLRGREELSRQFFNEKEIAHMADVRSLLAETAWLFFVSITAIVFFAAVFTLERSHKLLAKSFIYGGISSLVSIAIIVLASLDFERLFTAFHESFFSNDLWLMGGNDTLHVLFPETFFLSMLIKALIIASSIGTASLIIGIAFWRRNVRSQH